MTLSSFIYSRVGLPFPVFVSALCVGSECGAVLMPQSNRRVKLYGVGVLTSQSNRLLFVVSSDLDHFFLINIIDNSPALFVLKKQLHEQNKRCLTDYFPNWILNQLGLS
jgi:hypothetical protein